MLKLDKGRHLTILAVILKGTQTVTAAYLASHINVSVRAIKHDIRCLREQLLVEGVAHLLAVKGKRYICIAIDEEKMEAIGFTITMSPAIEEIYKEDMAGKKRSVSVSLKLL